MTGADLLPATVLKRKAVVYVRQSTQTQVQTNLESQRRQYDLVDEARNRGFRDVEVIDDDLGRSASGTMARPGFDRLVAWLCAGDVGAVLCFDASRLARNGRDWHHLLELCGLVGARVIDLDGVYDPCRPNDRLLLGMKGSISEFELGVLRARMYDAARSKARRGELRISVPVGYVWDREIGLGLDPDMRLQEAVRLIFARFRELGSARQVLLSLAADQLHFPRPSDGRRMIAFDWTPIRYRNVISVLKNPFYAGAYIYGKSEHRTAIVNGRAQKTYGHGKPFEEWEVVLKDHHEGYIDWAEFERNQKQLAANEAAMMTRAAFGGMADFRKWAASHCDVARLLGARMGLSGQVQEALGYLYERWDGRGMPGEARGEQIPLAVRVMHVAQDADMAWQTRRTATGRARRREPGWLRPGSAGGRGVPGRRGEGVRRPGSALGLGRRARGRARRAADGERCAARRLPVGGGRLRRPQEHVDRRPLARRREHRRARPPRPPRCRPGKRGSCTTPRSCMTSAGSRSRPAIWAKPGPLSRDEREQVRLHALSQRARPRRRRGAAAAGPAGRIARRALRRVGIASRSPMSPFR